MKKAVVLMNLGGPDKLDNVQPFLFNLFNDKAIISLPNPFRYLLAKLISSRRNKKAQGIYSRLGGGSPILPETQAQADALQSSLSKHGDFKVFICMRYWHPMSQEVVDDIKKYNPDEIILLPLYPQFSSTTTASSFDDFYNVAKKSGLDRPIKKLCCYYQDENFCQAYAELIKPYYEKALKTGAPIKMLFSAHGIPQNRIDAGDPYEWQVKKSVEKIVSLMAIDNLDYTICYQSKVGPLKWLEPATEHEIENAAKDKQAVILIPVAFVSEHSETLVELDMDYKELADEMGAACYLRVPTVRTHPSFIKSLTNITLNAVDSKCCNNLKDCMGRII